MRFACQTGMVRAPTLADRIQMIADCGFDGIEIHGRDLLDDPEATIRACREGPLPVAAICAGFRGRVIDADPEVRRRAVEDSVTILRRGAEAGAGGFIMVPFFGPDPLPDLGPHLSTREVQDRMLLATLREELAPVAEETGVEVWIEPLNRYEAQNLRTLDETWTRYVEPVASAKVRMLADFFHMQLEETDPAGALEKHLDRIGHIHLADRTRHQPGTSDMDYAKLFAPLVTGGYQGFASLECGVLGDPRQALSECVKYLHQCRERSCSAVHPG